MKGIPEREHKLLGVVKKEIIISKYNVKESYHSTISSEGFLRFWLLVS